MVALKTERNVFLWYMAPHPTPKEAPVDVTLTEILEHLQKAFDAKKAFAHIDSDGNLVQLGSATPAKNCIYIADWKPNKSGTAVALLINRGDPDVAHPSFINPLASTVKNVPPGVDEVQGWSSHLILLTKADASGRHRAAFERIPNVSSTLVQKYLDALIDQATSGDPHYVYEKAIRRGKKTLTEDRAYKLRLGINKVPSETLERDIRDGVLTGVTLIRTNPKYAGPGDPTVVKSVKEQVTLRVKDVDDGRMMEFARSVVAWGRNNEYDEVQFKVEELPGNRSSSPRFQLEKADAMDTLYVRSQRLTGFKTLLETCYSEVNKEIAERMFAELNNDANW
ncbi:MAG: hypothetical protein PSY12_04660 [bacterium]|nr:hypothetical protein [bacterium]